MARRKPYTVIGISRMRCVRCPRRARYQWQICADGRVFRPLCEECDIELNAMVMRWAWGDSREADIAAYETRART